jgi:hypothetical protein
VSRAAVALLIAGALGCGLAASDASAGASCRGAAARDQRHPCLNPTRSVSPSLADARTEPPSPCALTTQRPEPICRFGVRAAKARGHIALIGDSHALAVRPALDFVARREHWHAWSITAPGCFFSTAVEAMLAGPRAPCVAWFQAARRWFARHREIDTVFVMQNADTPIEVGPGSNVTDEKVAGFTRAWRSLPENVKRVIVIRDTPIANQPTFDCLARVIAAGTEQPGPACAFPRSGNLKEDSAVTAVQRLHAKRFQSVSLTHYFCDAAACYPVIGGTLVFRDIWGHLTASYARSLGPYLLAKVRRAIR